MFGFVCTTASRCCAVFVFFCFFFRCRCPARTHSSSRANENTNKKRKKRKSRNYAESKAKFPRRDLRRPCAAERRRFPFTTTKNPRITNCSKMTYESRANKCGFRIKTDIFSYIHMREKTDCWWFSRKKKKKNNRFRFGGLYSNTERVHEIGHRIHTHTRQCGRGRRVRV